MARARRRETLPAERPREIVSGETCLYLGRQYRLRLRASPEVRPLTLRAGWLELPVPPSMAGPQQAAYARAALMDWYTKRAREHLPVWAEEWAQKAGVELRDVRIADQAKRWGSCSKGVLRLNWRILQAPRRLVDYVVAHEVVHVLHEHHGAEFWAALGMLIPDYEARRERLRVLGRELVW